MMACEDDAHRRLATSVCRVDDVDSNVARVGDDKRSKCLAPLCAAGRRHSPRWATFMLDDDPAWTLGVDVRLLAND